MMFVASAIWLGLPALAAVPTDENSAADDWMKPPPIASPPIGIDRHQGIQLPRVTSLGRLPTGEGLIDFTLESVFGTKERTAGFERGTSTPVSFPSGREGVVVALGFFGPTTGTRVLFRQDPNAVVLLDVTGDWLCWQKIDQATLRLGTKVTGFGTLIRTSGRSHRGTGLNTEGHFQLLAVTDDGFRLLFEGIASDDCNNPGCRTRSLDYRFVDIDGDAVDEIVAKGQECTYTDDYELRDCAPLNQVYRFDGTRFVPTDDGLPKEKK